MCKKVKIGLTSYCLKWTLNSDELIRIKYREVSSKNDISKNTKDELNFWSITESPQIVRKASDHRHTGITTYYGIKFENPKSVKSF